MIGVEGGWSVREEGRGGACKSSVERLGEYI
jgi:hypothetical protein